MKLGWQRFPFLYPLLLFLILGITVLIFPPTISFSNQADGFAYYLPLRSWLYDGDFNFKNENTAYEQTYGSLPYDWRHLTKNGNYIFPYSIGPSILWSSFITPSYLINRDQNGVTLPEINGYASGDLLMLVLSSIFYGISGAILTYLAVIRFFPKNKGLILFSVIVCALATPVFYYLRYQPVSSHALSVFTASLFIFIWSRKVGEITYYRYFYLGACLGLAALVRWQDAIFIVLPLIEIITIIMGKTEKIIHLVFSFFMLLFGGLLFFLPQILFWQNVYGKFLLIPQGSTFFTFDDPHLIDFLFSFRHGLFSWSPIIIFSVMGLLIGLFKSVPDHKQQPDLRILFISSIIIFLFAITINGMLLDWHGSDAFGARRMVSLFPIFSLGIFYFLYILKRNLRIVFGVIFTIFIVYMQLFALVFYQGKISHTTRVTPGEIFFQINKLFKL